MRFNIASFLLLTAIIAAIVPPGYPAYIGGYVGLLAAVLALLVYGWREPSAFAHPISVAILVAIILLIATVPVVYQGDQDLLAPVLVLPMLSTIALGVLAHRAGWVPSAQMFAMICLAAAAIAMLGGVVEHFILGVKRPGLGNNPIHYGSLAVMAGCLAMVGVAGGGSRWRYVFLIGPLFGLGAATISGSRGPTAAGLVMIGIGMLMLLIWFWRDRLFRLTVLAGGAVVAGAVLYLIASGDARVTRLAQSALDIFSFTGGKDDIRAALYASALRVMERSPLFGVGFGQIMTNANLMFPDLVPAYHLENLHADWANFAVMAGGIGLVALVLFLGAPLLLLLDARVRQDRVIVLGAVLLVTGQLTLGVSNAMFGVLPQTMVYAVALGYLLVRARRLVAAQQATTLTASPARLVSL